MTEHKLHSCDDPNCYCCEGNLALCEVCKGAECELPTHCPGESIQPHIRARICAGETDYYNGRWFDLTDPTECQEYKLEKQGVPT